MASIGSILKNYLEENRISQSEFADMYNLSVKHVNEIINEKTGVSLDMVLLISLLTDFEPELLLMVEKYNQVTKYLNKTFNNEKEIKQFLNSYNVKEVDKNGWYNFRNTDDNTITYIDLLQFLKTNDLDNHLAYTKKYYMYKEVGEKDLIKVALWIAHCNNTIEKVEIPKYDSKKLDDLFKELKIERMKPFNKDRLINLFNKYGIILVIEEPLKGTKVRGVTHVKINTPVIYLNTYYKNISSFYFALYHELGHIKKHYNMLKSKTIIHSPDVEDEIDTFALDKMIPNSLYQELLNTPNKSIILKKNNIPESFFYSRMAYEGRISYHSKKYLDSQVKIDLNHI